MYKYIANSNDSDHGDHFPESKMSMSLEGGPRVGIQEEDGRGMLGHERFLLQQVLVP